MMTIDEFHKAAKKRGSFSESWVVGALDDDRKKTMNLIREGFSVAMVYCGENGIDTIPTSFSVCCDPSSEGEVSLLVAVEFDKPAEESFFWELRRESRGLKKRRD